MQESHSTTYLRVHKSTASDKKIQPAHQAFGAQVLVTRQKTVDPLNIYNTYASVHGVQHAPPFATAAIHKTSVSPPDVAPDAGVGALSPERLVGPGGRRSSLKLSD